MKEENVSVVAETKGLKPTHNSGSSEYKDLSVIKSVFEHQLNTKMWSVCGDDKVPRNTSTGLYLEWTNTDLYMTFKDIEKWMATDIYPGFGLFTGISEKDINDIPYASVRCFDFDNVLKDGEVIDHKILKLLDYLDTFVEISSSGNGLHAFITSDYDVGEFTFKKDLFNGKYYTGNHFIKLTGNVFKKYNNPVNYFDKKELTHLKKVIGIEPISTGNTRQVNLSYTGKLRSWESILTEAVIPFFPNDYVGRQRVHGDKIRIAVESWKIECPNINSHTTDRVGDKSAHMAILTRWDDQSSSLRCNHHACDPEKKPNLLQKLWDKIRENKDIIALERAGLI